LELAYFMELCFLKQKTFAGKYPAKVA